MFIYKFFFFLLHLVFYAREIIIDAIWPNYSGTNLFPKHV